MAGREPPRRAASSSARAVPWSWNERANGISKRRSRWDSSSRRSVPGRSSRSRVSTMSRPWPSRSPPTRSSRSTGRRTTSSTWVDPTPISASPTGVNGSVGGTLGDARDLDVQARHGLGRDRDGLPRRLEGRRAQHDLHRLAVGHGDPDRAQGPAGPGRRRLQQPQLVHRGCPVGHERDGLASRVLAAHPPRGGGVAVHGVGPSVLGSIRAAIVGDLDRAPLLLHDGPVIVVGRPGRGRGGSRSRWGRPPSRPPARCDRVCRAARRTTSGSGGGWSP